MPDKTNIGTASNGNESIPPNIALITYSVEIVKFGSISVGVKDAIVKVADTGTDKSNNTTKAINTNVTCIISPPLGQHYQLIHDATSV